MKESVNSLITVKSESTMNGDTDSIEMMVGGRFDATDDGFTIIYDETDPETSEITHTTVSIVTGGRITVSREGGVNTQMIFEKGHRHLVYYDTKYGSLLVGVVTHRMDVSLERSVGGKLEVDYALEIDSQVANEIKLCLTIAPSAAQ